MKSLTLAPYVEGGSVLILFTPRNPLQDQNYNYNMVSVPADPILRAGSKGKQKRCSDKCCSKCTVIHLGTFSVDFLY
jgi:hypothetical protein